MGQEFSNALLVGRRTGVGRAGSGWSGSAGPWCFVFAAGWLEKHGKNMEKAGEDQSKMALLEGMVGNAG